MIVYIYIVILRLLCLVQGEHHEFRRNSYLYMAYTYAKSANVSKCWVCTQVPNHAEEGIPLRPLPLGWADLIIWDQLTQSFRKPGARTVGFIKECERVDFFKNASCTGGPGYMNRYLPKFNIDKRVPSLILSEEKEAPPAILCVKSAEGRGTFLGNSRCRHEVEITSRICLTSPEDDRECKTPGGYMHI